MPIGGDDEDARQASKAEMKAFAERAKILRQQAYLRWKDQRLAGTRNEAFEYLRERGFENSLSSFKDYELGKRMASREAARQLILAYDVPGATIAWLLYGGNEPEWGRPLDLAPAGPRTRFIPRLIPKEAAKMPGIYQSVAKKHEQLVPILSTEERSFGLLSFLFPIVDDSMTPTSPYEVHRFPKGDWVVIDPGEAHQLGDFVCVVLNGSDEAILRQYREVQTPAGRAFALAPLNSNYATEIIMPDRPVAIKGVMIEHIRNYRRP